MLAVLLAAASAGTIPRACSRPSDREEFPFCDPKLGLDARVADLVGRLREEEKPVLLTARASPRGAIPRLGVPEYDWGGNCVHGVQARCGSNFTRCPTSFPTPGALGATFNRTGWRAMGAAIGVELRSLWLQGVGEDHDGNLPHIGLDCWSPNVAVTRDPRWGRNMETASEDPLLAGLFGVEYSLGLQRSPLERRFLQAVATLKHFDANSLEGHWDANGTFDPANGTVTRHTANAVLTRRDAASTYLRPFRLGVEQGGAAGVMCSYNAVNGTPACASAWLLRTVLRSTWRFDGYVTSDSGAVADIYKAHRFCANATCAVSRALAAGCDVDSADWPQGEPWGTGSPYMDEAARAVRTGALTRGQLDAAVARALRVRFRLGLFDPIDDQPLWRIPPTAVRAPEHERLARELSAQSLVLLQNPALAYRSGAEPDRASPRVLPLSAAEAATTAVIGPLSSAREVLLGKYFGQVCPGNHTAAGTGEQRPEWYFACVATPLEAVRALARGPVLHAPGLPSVRSTDRRGLRAAVEAARRADQAILFVGLDSSVEEEGRDRAELGLPGAQPALIRAVLRACARVVVVLINGGAVAAEAIRGGPAAIVEGFYPGFYGSETIAQALFGDVRHANRFGKLPVTVYRRSYTRAVGMLDFHVAPHAGNALGRTYRYHGGDPAKHVLWPFGFGLSYTSFSLHWAARGADVRKASLDNRHPDRVRTFELVVANTGAVRGDTVITAFFSPTRLPAAEAASAVAYQLFDFQRVSLGPAEAATLRFDASARALQLYDEAGDGVSVRGEYELSFCDQGVDQSGAGTRLTARVVVAGVEKAVLQPLVLPSQ